MEDKKRINKILSDIKKNTDIKECFYHKSNECKGSIKSAHSISRGNRLDLIKGLVDNNDRVFSLSEIIVENNIPRKTVGSIGWGKAASTFHGFCDLHDTNLFEPIENGNDFDGSTEHCFLHSYRTFAYTFHHVKKTYKLGHYAADFTSKAFNELPISNLTEGFKKLQEKANDTSATDEQRRILNDTLKQFEGALGQLNSALAAGHEQISSIKEKLFYSDEELDSNQLHSPLKWMERYKTKLDYAIENKVYDGLKYYCKVKDKLFPFASAFAFSPEFLYSEADGVIPLSNSTDILNTCLTVTILPDESNKTIILFSCFDGDRQSEYFLNKLFSMKDEEFEKAVTSIIIRDSSNTYLNPTMWEQLGDRQKILDNEINIKRSFDELPKKLFMSEINFFDSEFSAENLRIKIKKSRT